MKRKIHYAIYIMIFTFCFILDVEAKNIVKQCNYESSNSSLTLNLYDNNSSEATITKFSGKNKNNSESVQNWKDYIETSSANECPKKALVTKGTFGFNVYVGVDDSELQSAANNKLSNAVYLNYVDTVATCSYDFKINGSSNPFTISVGKYGSLNYSIIPNEHFTASNGEIYYVNYKNMTEFKKELYNNGTLSSTCPKLSVGIDSQNTIWIYNGKSMSTSAMADTESYRELQSLIGTLNIKDSNISVDSKKEKEYCSLSKKVWTSSSPISIRFYDDVNGNHMYEVSQYRNSNINVNARYDGTVSINLLGTSFTISMDNNWDNISSYWSNSCSDTPIYLYTPDADPKRFYVTSKEVDPLSNASNLGEKDDGKPYVEDEGSGSEPSIDPTKEKQDSNVTNLDISKYCSEKNVARTLKFVGLMLFLAKIFVPALIIIMGCIDFGNAIVSGKDDEIKKRIPIVIKRFIAGVIIFFIPTIINFLFNQIETYNSALKKYQACWTCILNPDDCVVE